MKRTNILRHPEDIHLVIFHVVVVVAYFLAWICWNHLHDTHWLSKAVYVISVALALGIASGVDIAVNFHNQIHRSVFLNRSLDRWFARLWTVTSGWPYFVFDVAHHVHHEHLGSSGDWTIDISQPNKKAPHILIYALTCWPLRPVYGMIAETRRRGKAFRNQLLGESIFFVFAWSMPFLLDWKAALAVWLAPQVVGNLIIVGAGMHVQHAAPAAHGSEMGFDSITALNKWFNLAMFNIGFHNTHHEHPRVHWAALPRLFERDAAKVISSGSRVLKSGNFEQASILAEIGVQNEKQWFRIDSRRVNLPTQLPKAFSDWYSCLPTSFRLAGRSMIALWALAVVISGFLSSIFAVIISIAGYELAKKCM